MSLFAEFVEKRRVVQKQHSNQVLSSFISAAIQVRVVFEVDYPKEILPEDLRLSFSGKVFEQLLCVHMWKQPPLNRLLILRTKFPLRFVVAKNHYSETPVVHVCVIMARGNITDVELLSDEAAPGTQRRFIEEVLYFFGQEVFGLFFEVLQQTLQLPAKCLAKVRFHHHYLLQFLLLLSLGLNHRRLSYTGRLQLNECTYVRLLGLGSLVQNHSSLFGQVRLLVLLH